MGLPHRKMQTTFIKDQKAMQRSAHQWVLDACKTFDEIMTGPNKLQEK